jgi:hypothetical protein
MAKNWNRKLHLLNKTTALYSYNDDRGFLIIGLFDFLLNNDSLEKY